MSLIPASHRDLIDGPVVVTLTTVSAEGQPYAVAVWCRAEGDEVLITSDAGVRKHRNVQANPRVALLALDPANPQRYLSLRGEVVAMEYDRDTVVAELDRQTLLYTGAPHYYGSIEPVANRDHFSGVLLRIRLTGAVVLG